jgi:hypothetical protein
MKSILDPSFRYTAGFGMDLRPAAKKPQRGDHADDPAQRECESVTGASFSR